MKHKKLALLFAAAVIGVFAGSTLAQNDVFSSPDAEYTFAIPDAKWKMTEKPSAATQNAEMVWADRADGLLELRKITVPKDQILTDLIHGSELDRLSFKKGFVSTGEENFTGRYRGSVYNYEYVASGRPMAGRNYYLRVNDTTVYSLKFSGPKDNIRSLRGQADAIARTFNVK